MTVLMVRPEGKCEQTCAHFQAHGLPCEGLPLMKLAAIEPNIEQFRTNLIKLAEDDWIISTSTFASKLAFDVLQKLENDIAISEVLNKINWFAIGKKSAQVLSCENSSQSRKVCFPEKETSEGLLAHLGNISTYDTKVELFPEKKRKIIILKGDGGRTLLQDSLSAMGHTVMEAKLYKRKVVKPAMLSKSWYQSHISCVVVTSGELLQATFQYFDNESEWLKSLPWFVVSERMANIAKDYGIKTIFVSGAANNAALFSTVSVANVTRQ